jgi:hypothetical protein
VIQDLAEWYEQLEGREHAMDVVHWFDNRLSELSDRPKDHDAILLEFFDEVHA